MAQGKKSFIAYSDWKDIFDELPNEDAGKLIKHIFAYVNDENPTSDSILIKAVFANIKSTLKRDLIKWDKQLEQRKNAGIQSAISRKNKSTKFNGRSTVVNETERNSTVSVNDSDSDINNRLLSEIEISDVPSHLVDFFKIAKEFQRLFITNLQEKNASFETQEKARFKTYVDPIRLMITKNEATVDELRDVWLYLESKDGDFWKKNILSTSKLREQISKLVMSARSEQKPFKKQKIEEKL